MIWLVLAAGVAAWWMTAALRRYALSRSLMDIPNARSSHTLPTPRGGGLSFVVAFLLAALCMAIAGPIAPSVVVGVLGAGGLVAVIGFMDDHGHIAARWRLLGHFAAAAWGLAWLGGMPPISVFGFTLAPLWLSSLFGALYLVWLLNLYNFMDGIDGLASVEAICVCVGASLLYWVTDHAHHAWLPLLLAATVAGFLCWNFPPARIFMGDAGSGFLGMVLGLLALLAGWVNPLLFWGWLILLGVFVVDATFTLVRRLLRGDKVYQAHRSHAYQYATRHHGSHRTVTLAVAAINLGWLLPVAMVVVVFQLDGALGTLVAYVPLIVLALIYKAGEKE
ncbi:MULTISPECIES: MraY family glycosyltransferase [Pseudomonas]|uniref:Glycosyltransferase family 4 protein n=1 Tax=Pseudomonas juntendi TaxID=2666183 RepID=A0A7W2PTJ8_9PSED|nr:MULTISPECIES: glycosyltransferase family 4 protein [Pseudomonas]QEQ87093.1 glycosyltransferase family 4 protein [Pseudomonas putida]MBA6060304.1 glycosyltransferase family 4 protein [Pseudomonas juntendi]MBA6128092.1 glycosyltransferase family 4 protein [Pseudomonas juntendi]MBA6144324.1 glycosyltransferase family 4 protein [Pseudomonas juntendi]MCK2111315.1 glycosyltransferase family 4 protein [Pseudomonas juntendi]